MRAATAVAVLAALAVAADPPVGAAVPGAAVTVLTEVGSYTNESQGTSPGLAFGDLDEDGDLDLIAAGSPSFAFDVRLNDGTGRFGDAALYSNSAGNLAARVNDAALADLDGDGHLDALLSGLGNSIVRWGDGTGGFDEGVEGTRIDDAGGEDVHAVDADGDGDLDVVGVRSDHVFVHRNDGGRSFTAQTHELDGATMRASAVGDFDDDGRPDVAFLTRESINGETGVVVAFRNGDGGYSFVRLGGPAFNGGRGVAVGDVDGDGVDDLVAAHSVGTPARVSGVEVFVSDGDRTFTSRPSTPTPDYAQAVEVADYNGDGNVDLAVSGNVDDVFVLEGFGDGTFDTARRFSSARFNIDLAVGDVDGDGRPDLGVGDQFGFDYVVMRNLTVPDTTAPTTTITRAPSSPSGTGGWDTAAVQLAVTASDGAATSATGVASIRCVLDPAIAPTSFSQLPSSACVYAVTGGAPVGTDGAHTLYAAAVDHQGNAGSVVSLSLKVDRSAPTTTLTPAPSAPTGNGGWYRGDVTVVAAGADPVGGSGVGATRCALDPTTIPMSYAALPATPCPAVTTDGVHTLYAASIDGAGNAGPVASLVVRRDVTPPTVVVTTPADGGAYRRSATITAAYSCTDVASGVGGCTATVANGQRIDTATPGLRTFAVTAVDQAGNATTVTSRYEVCTALLDFFGIQRYCLYGSPVPPSRPPRK